MESLKKSNSKYAKNFLFFYSKIENMKINATMQYEKFCKMFLAKRLFILLVVCDSQESAMTIFNTLNSRGKPLSNADILKGYIYKNKKDSQKQEFANEWKELETKIESSNRVKSLDFLFLQYMHIIRAQEPDFDTTTPSVINFFTKKDKKVNYGAHKDWLYKDETIPFLKILIDFWLTPSGYLSNKACRYMRILDIFQNDSWKSFVSSLVWKNRESIEDKERFSQDFDKYLPVLLRNITLLFLNNAGTNDKTKELVFKMNVALIKHDTFESLKYNIPNFENFCEIARQFNAQKAKYLLFLYAYLYSNFSDDIEDFELQVEHILPKQWQNANFNGWDKETHAQYLNQIGNKILLPKASNIKCLENFFAKKQEEYKKCENLTEVRDLGERTNHSWLQEDIQNRNREIYQRLKSFIDTNM